MIWVKLLFLLIFFDVIMASTRNCAQCIAGNFAFRRNLMQDSSIGQSMGWVEEWKDTNCVKGIMNTIPCDHACLKVTIVKSHAEENAVEGIMMDCSDYMIHSSPDLPQYVNFKAYDENGTFSGKRNNFTITYSFTMTGLESVDKIKEDHGNIVLPFYQEDYKVGTIIIICLLPALFIVFCCWLCYLFVLSQRKKSEARNRRFQVRYINVRASNQDQDIEEISSDPSSPSAPSDELHGSHEEENKVPIA